MARLFPAVGASPGIVSLNAHFDHAHGLPAIGNLTHNESDLFSVSQLPANSLLGRSGSRWAATRASTCPT